MRGVKPQDSNRRARGRRKHPQAHKKDNARATLLFLRALREIELEPFAPLRPRP